MNAKHLACVVLALVAILLLQGALQVRKRLTKMTEAVAAAEASASSLSLLLTTETNMLAALRENSNALIAYLESWRAPLNEIHTPEAGELSVSSRIKESGLVSLAQRFEVVTGTDTPNIPRIVRANLTFEDDFARTLNWLGSIEADLPASRVSHLHITRGQSGNDIRMDLTIDLPLLSEEAKQ